MHLKQLISVEATEPGRRLLRSITNLVNLTLSGSVPEYVRDSFFGAKLCALSKKDGGLRPIAIGSVYRRLASRMAAHHLASVVGPELRPVQMGVGTPLGCEAAVHATREFLTANTSASATVVKVDMDNILMSDSDTERHTCVEWDVQDCGYTAHHSKVIVQFQVKRARAKPTYRSGRNWRLLDTNSLLNDLADVDWHAVVRQSNTCSDQWDAFSTAVNGILDRHVPVRRYRVHNPRPPSISDDTRELMERRRTAKSTADNDTYRRLNAEVKRAIRADYRSSMEQRVAEAPPSKMWQQIRPVVASSKTAPTEPVNLTGDELNVYFTSVGSCNRDSVVAEFERSGRAPLHTRLHRVHTEVLNLVLITRDELRAIVYSMPNRDTCIEGDIPVSVLKRCFDVIGRVLLQIVKCSIVSETVPESWKRAVVIPLYKKGDPKDASNFRPITNIPVICKIAEKAVHRQVSSFLSRNDLCGAEQHGFTENRSTSTALLTVTDHILRGMDSSEVTLLALIDLSKGFDVIDHSTLLTKIEQLQIIRHGLKATLGATNNKFGWETLCHLLETSTLERSRGRV